MSLGPDIPIFWEYEDNLPDDIPDESFAEMFPVSRIIYGVRMYPYFWWSMNGVVEKAWLRAPKTQ